MKHGRERVMRRIGPLLLVPFLATRILVAQTSGLDVSKVGTTAGTFLEIGVGATAASMGQAYVSLASDATALHWNPAGIALIPQADANVVQTNWIADTQLEFAGVALPIQGFGSLGFSVTALTMGDMMVRTVEMPEGTGEYFSAGDLSAGLTYARQLSERFSIGLSAKYIQETIWHESASAFAVDIGTIFKTDLLGGMILGATLSNFGSRMQMAGRDAREFIRIDPTKEGTNGQIPTDIELDSWDLPLQFQFGVSTRVVDDDEYRWTVAVDALHPNDNFESVNVGTELAFEDFLFFRAGYQSLFLSDSETGLTLGVGVTSSDIFGKTKIEFDYAYQDMGRLDGVHVFEVGVHF